MMQADRARKEQERKNVQEARARALAIEQAKEAARLQARREQQIALAAARAHYAEKARPLSNGPQMKRLQIVLAKLGFDPGTPDGVEGKRTRAAVKAFEDRHKLPVTGKATTSVLALAERKLQRN